jgi:hypothetical protein
MTRTRSRRLAPLAIAAVPFSLLVLLVLFTLSALLPAQATQSTTTKAAAGAEWLGAIEPVTSPAASRDSAQPQITVQGDRAVVSWIERQGTRATLKFAERTAAGAWTEARTVASGDDFFVNWADVPSVRALADGSLAAHWLQKSGSGTYAYDVKLSFSKDSGRTWTAAVSPHSDGTQTEHGFASLFQAPGAGAGLGLVWLDGRAMKSGSHGTGAAADAGHGGGGGAMTVRAAIFGADGVQKAETLVDARVCECCPTAAAVTSEGVIAAFRNRAEGEIRDIYTSRLDSGSSKWSEPVAVHNDNWKMPACPVNGPALSASGRRVAIAWFTMQQEQGHAFVAFSDDAGRTFGKPVRVDDEISLGRVDVELLPDGSAVASWIEYSADAKSTSFRIRRIERSGKVSPPTTVTSIGSGRTSGYPRMARVGGELLFAWTDTAAAPRVTTAHARLTGPVSSSAQ